MPQIKVIGVGNEYRSDDGVGIAVARMISDDRLPGVEIVEMSGEGVALMDAWKSMRAVILVDAVDSGSPAGTIHRFDVMQGRLPARTFRCTSHTFSVLEAVELSRILDQLPPVCIMYGIEGVNYAMGTHLTPAVERAAAKAARQIQRELCYSLDIR